MHTNEIRQSLDNVVRGLEDRTMDLKTAATITRAAGAEIKRWTAQIAHAKQTNTVAVIPELQMDFDCRGKVPRWIRH
jgi:hypothetical protein